MSAEDREIMSSALDRICEIREDDEDLIFSALSRIACFHKCLLADEFEHFLLDAEVNTTDPRTKRLIVGMLGILSWKRETLTAQSIVRLKEISVDASQPIVIREQAIVALSGRFQRFAGTALESLHQECIATIRNALSSDVGQWACGFLEDASIGHRMVAEARSLLASGRVRVGENEIDTFFRSETAIKADIPKLGRDWFALQMALTRADLMIWGRSRVRRPWSGDELRAVPYDLFTPQGTMVECFVTWAYDAKHDVAVLQRVDPPSCNWPYARDSWFVSWREWLTRK